MLRRKSGARPADVLTLDILSSRGRTIRPKTLNQKRYVDAIDKHTIVFAIGPAGTGEDVPGNGQGGQVAAGQRGQQDHPDQAAVEAGERLGFLPGNLYEKIDPYLRPLHDALHDMVAPDAIPRQPRPGRSRSRRWHTCAAGRSMTRSSSSTRRKTRRPNR